MDPRSSQVSDVLNRQAFFLSLNAFKDQDLKCQFKHQCQSVKLFQVQKDISS